MTIIKRGFTEVSPENEITYFGHLEGVISSVDELASLEVIKSPSGSYVFRITPSIPMYSQPLLKSILDFHKLLGIRLNLSKSIKNTSTISFVISNK